MATANFTVTRRILLIALLLTVLFVFTHSANANYSYTVHVHAIRNPEMGLGSETIPSSQHVGKSFPKNSGTSRPSYFPGSR